MDEEDINKTLSTLAPPGDNDEELSPEILRVKAGLFWFSTLMSIFLSFVATVGNCLVIYVASRRRNSGMLRYLNVAIKSLAFTDLLAGILANPLSILYYYWGMK